MYLGWYDADRRTTVERKITDAIARYVEKFGADPEVVLVGPHDVAEARAAITAVIVREVGFIPRSTFYVGVDDELESR